MYYSFYKIYYQPVCRRINPDWFPGSNQPILLHSEKMLLKAPFCEFDGDEYVGEDKVQQLLFRSNIPNIKIVDFIQLIDEQLFEIEKSFYYHVRQNKKPRLANRGKIKILNNSN